MSRNSLLTLFRTIILLTFIALCSVASFAGDEQRQVRSKVKPTFPELARKMNLNGTVRLQVQISPAGTVISALPVGGSPVFIDSAIEAVKKWRFEPAPATTSQTLVFNFVKNDAE